MSVILDQTKYKDTRHACTIYTLLLILMFDFGVKVNDDWILKLVYYAERIGVLVLTGGAYFSIIYPALVKFINLRYGIKLDLRSKDIRNGILTEGITFSLGLKKLSNLQQSLSLDDKEFTKADVDRILFENKGSGHNLAWKNGVVLDPWKGIAYRMSKETLIYATNKGLFYPTTRYLVAGDDFTKLLQKSLLNSLKVKRKKEKDNTVFLSHEEFLIIKHQVKLFLNIV